jgi:hypothetical protein
LSLLDKLKQVGHVRKGELFPHVKEMLWGKYANVQCLIAFEVAPQSTGWISIEPMSRDCARGLQVPA